MSWQSFQEGAFSLTEAEVRKLSKQVIKEYRLAIKNINAKLTKLYANELSGIAPADYFNHMIKRDRLKNLLAQITADYTKASQQAATFVRNSISLAFSNTYYRKAYALEWLVPNAQLGVLPKSLIELSTLGTKEAWDSVTKSVIKKYGERINYMPQSGSLSSLLLNDRRAELKRIQTAINQGLLNGTSKPETMKIIKNIIGNEMLKDGQLSLTGAKASAQRIIRTETNRTMNMGSYAESVYADSEGIEIMRMLSSVLDLSTRPQSASMDKQKRAVDKPFTYPNGRKAMTPGTTGVPGYDINDRETVVDLVNGEEPSIRRGRNPNTGKNEVFEYKSFNEWAKSNNLTKNKYGQIIA